MTHSRADGRPCRTNFDPAPRDGKIHDWKDKPFVVESIAQSLRVPFPAMFARTVSRIWKQAREAGATRPPEDSLPMLQGQNPAAVLAQVY